THVWVAGTHRVDASLGRKHDRVPFAEQMQFGNAMRKFSGVHLCALRQRSLLAWQCMMAWERSEPRSAQLDCSHAGKVRGKMKTVKACMGQRDMPTIDRDGVKIHYEIHGDGPLLILTHGYSSTSAMWQGQVAALSKHHKLLLWDMRGHGQSDYPEDPAAYSE